MKKLLYLILLIPFFSFGQYNNAYLNSEADSIKNETIARKNNATRLVRLWKNQNKSFVNGTMMTAIGTSGPASFNSSTGVLNIPNYSAGGSGVLTLSNGLTLSGTNGVLGGNLDGSSTITTITGHNNNAFMIDISVGDNTGRSIFQQAGVFTYLSQGDFTGSYHNTRWTATGFQLEYPVNSTYVLGNGLTKSLTIGNSGTGFVTSPHLFSTNPLTATGTQNDLLILNASGEIVHTTGAGYDGTSNFFYLNKSLKELPVVLGSISSTQNDYAIGDGIIFEINSGDLGTTRSITGIAGGFNGRVIYLHSTNNSDVIAINHQDSGSSASNRIKCASGTTMNLNPNRWLMLSYSTTDNRWHDVTF